MLTIKNYKKIRNRWFGDWQIGKFIEEPTYYALQAFHKNANDSITMIIFRQTNISHMDTDYAYNIALMKDGTTSADAIEDVIFKAVLEDMDIFGEALEHYLNTLK